MYREVLVAEWSERLPAGAPTEKWKLRSQKLGPIRYQNLAIRRAHSYHTRWAPAQNPGPTPREAWLRSFLFYGLAESVDRLIDVTREKITLSFFVFQKIAEKDIGLQLAASNIILCFVWGRGPSAFQNS